MSLTIQHTEHPDGPTPGTMVWPLQGWPNQLVPIQANAIADKDSEDVGNVLGDPSTFHVLINRDMKSDAEDSTPARAHAMDLATPAFQLIIESEPATTFREYFCSSEGPFTAKQTGKFRRVCKVCHAIFSDVQLFEIHERAENALHKRAIVQASIAQASKATDLNQLPVIAMDKQTDAELYSIRQSGFIPGRGP